MVIVTKGGNVKSEQGKRLKGIQIIAALSDEVRVEKGVTFKDLFTLAKPIIQYVGPYSWCLSYKEFYKELKKKPSSTSWKKEHIEFYWVATAWGDQLDISTNFRIFQKGKKEPFGNHFVPVNDLKNQRIVLNESVLISQIQVKEGSKPKTREVFSGKKNFTLIDLLYSVFHNISFYGPPKKRDKITKDMMADTGKAKDFFEVLKKVKVKK